MRTSRSGRVYELTLVSDQSETDEKLDKPRHRGAASKTQMQLFG